jgi:carbamoyl-phosphate synthase large subunit
VPGALHRVLLTGVGAPGTRGTLYALHHNPEGAGVRVVGVDARADAVGRHWVEQFHQVPFPESDSYADILLEICEAAGVELIIPQTTRETARLAELQGQFAAWGVQVMVAPAAAVRRANDKAALLDLFATLGLPYPTYKVTTSEAELRAAAAALGHPTHPVVVKPPVSNGMRGFRVLKEKAWDLHRFLAEKPGGVEIGLDDLTAILGRGGRWPTLLVSEYLPGAEYSVDAFIGRNGAIALPRLRRVVVGGISADTVLESRPDMAAITLQAAGALGLTYAFGFQFKLDDQGRPKLLECNPRVQGTMVAGVFAGVNVIWLALQEALGRAPVPPHAAAAGATFQRFWGGIGCGDGIAHEI